MDVVTRAIEQETVAVPWAFLLKLVFTAVTLAAGFKGGEVVPSFFVGATFGCAVSPLLGLPVGFGAAGRSGRCFLRRDQLPGGIHAAGGGAVSARRGCCILPWPAA
ncbi:MAG: chloride channel protein [Dysosmobacter sp.]